jgi:hypothetical protein
MTDLDSHPLIDPQKEELINSLRNEITSLKSRLNKKEEKVVALENMLNTTLYCLNTERHACADLKDKLEDVIEMLKKRVPQGDILDFLRVKDDEMRSYPI